MATTIRARAVAEPVECASSAGSSGTWIACVVALALLAAPTAGAQTGWRLTPTVGLSVGWTDNVNLAPPDLQQSDVVFLVTPGFRVDYETPRTLLRGSVNVPIRLYARTGDENNEVFPQADLLGRVTVVDNFLFVEGQATVQQTFYNPFGPRPTDLINATDNRYTSQTYRVTPYIQGLLPNNIRYELRNDNTWTNENNTPQRDNAASYTNRLYGFLQRDPLPLGWRLAIDRKDYRFEDQSRSQLMELVRAAGIYRPDPAWEVFTTAGYERNRFPLTNYGGAIYGGGFKWRPSERTRLDAAAEHRFFGTSYLVAFDHRTPRSVWTLNAKRDVTNYPEQVASVPAGTSVSGALDSLLRSRIPDPTERAQFVADFIADRGLPETLVDPISLYSQLLYLQDALNASIGLLGVRNALIFSASRLKTQPISGAGTVLPPVVGTLQNNTQLGGGVAWSHALTPTASLTASGTYTRTEANPPFDASSDQYIARLALVRQIGPNTRGYVVARYQRFESDVSPDYRETLLLAGFNYAFR